MFPSYVSFKRSLDHSNLEPSCWPPVGDPWRAGTRHLFRKAGGPFRCPSATAAWLQFCYKLIAFQWISKTIRSSKHSNVSCTRKSCMTGALHSTQPRWAFGQRSNAMSCSSNQCLECQETPFGRLLATEPSALPEPPPKHVVFEASGLTK